MKKPKPSRRRTAKPLRSVDPNRALAAVEVLEAVWLDENFELECQIPMPPTVTEDANEHAWVTVKIHVPALDIDCWLDGTHNDHPDNRPDTEED